MESFPSIRLPPNFTRRSVIVQNGPNFLGVMTYTVADGLRMCGFIVWCDHSSLVDALFSFYAECRVLGTRFCKIQRRIACVV